MRAIDVHHLDRPRVICCYELDDGVLVDPGPASSLPAVLAELGDLRPRAVLLTHIHLDHAGGTGTLLERFEGLEVWVHERGAPHLIDPSKLLTSAGRLYGEENMDRLWGDVRPVPEDRIHLLRGGETVLDAFRVEYTPGHASHHVCYLHEPSGTAFTGDVAGVRIPPSDFVMAPTPPPDIDLEAWERSLDLVAGWRPRRLAITHFGYAEDPRRQIEAARRMLEVQAQQARRLDVDDFSEWLSREIEETADLETAASFDQAGSPDLAHAGLVRYWRKRDEASSATGS